MHFLLLFFVSLEMMNVLVCRNELVFMDPQQRLLLHAAAEALCTEMAQTNQSVAVHVGIGTVDYYSIASQALSLSPFTATGVAGSVAAGRLSYTFGFQGPSSSIDTACSSSLVAMHHSMLGICYRDECRGVVAGVNLTLSAGKTAAFSITGASQFACTLSSMFTLLHSCYFLRESMDSK